MIKKVVLIVAILLGFSGHIFAQEEQIDIPVNKVITPEAVTSEKETEPAIIDKIAFVLFTLVGNSLRMEKYDVNELGDIESISKKASRDKHLILSINFKEKGLTPKSIGWNTQNPGQMSIATGKKSNPIYYYLQLESLFKNVDEDIMAVCFDCNVKNNKIESKESKWQSHINIELPIKIDNTEINLVLDSKIKAACGFFMEKDNFEKLVNVSGTITKSKALEDGLVIQEIQEIEEIPKIDFQAIFGKIKDSAWYLKNRIISIILLLRQFVGSSWKKNTDCGII